MVNEFKFGGRKRASCIMYILTNHYYDEYDTCFISNYKYWKRLYKKKTRKLFFKDLITCINHENLHIVLGRIGGVTASKAIDKRKIFGANVRKQENIGIKIPDLRKYKKHS